MSRVTRCKHVLREMMADDFELPTAKQQIVRVVNSRGNNLHEVQSPDNIENYLVSMPTKFRKNVWVKRGDYVLVEPIEEGDKVKAEICRILTPEHIKEFNKHGVWPKEFSRKREHEVDDANSNSTNSDSEEFLVKNFNRPQAYQESDSEETASSSEEDD